MKSYIRGLLIACICILPVRFIHAQLQGTVSPSVVEVRDRFVTTLRLQATETIPANTIIHVKCPGGITNIIWPVLTNIIATTNGASGTLILSSLSAAIAEPPIWDHDNLPVIIAVQIKTFPLLAGQSIFIALGTELLSPNFKIVAPATSGTVEFSVAIQDLSGAWTEVDHIPINFRSSIPSQVKVIAPSVAKTGQPVPLKMIVEDLWYNRNTTFTGTIGLSSDGPVDLPAEIVFTSADSGYKEIPVAFQEEGFYKVDLTVNSVTTPGALMAPGYSASSNYTWVQDEPEYYIYWGDLHSHSGWSRDGQGPNTFNYARYTAGLDYFSPSEHVDTYAGPGVGINPKEWSEIKNSILEYHKPGSFVPITAYETTYYANQGGHHIAYFEHHDSVINEIPLLTRETYHTIFELWDRLDQLPSYISALSWPHFTGTVFYLDVSDPAWNLDELSINSGPISRLVGEEYISPYRTLWEIFSEHGQSEEFDPSHPLNDDVTAFWFFQDALAMGEKLGVTAFTDGHIAKPGYPASGLGAALADTLERSALFDAFRSRSTYGTTSERIIIDFRVNDSIMGKTVDIDNDMVPIINFTVHGTGALDRVEVVKWDFISGVYGEGFHPQFEVIRTIDVADDSPFCEDEFMDIDFYGHAVYYLRVIQQGLVDGKPVWGWSSPVWVNNLNLDTVITAEEMHIRDRAIEVYPNPVKPNSGLSVRMEEFGSEQVRITVYDGKGALQIDEVVQVQPGGKSLQLPVGDLPAGQYWMRLADPSSPGSRPFGSASFVVQ